MKEESQKRIIIYTIIGTLLGILGRWITLNNFDIPLYLNFIGVFVASYYAGSKAGTTVSLFTVLFGIAYGSKIDSGLIYMEASTIIPMICAVIFVGEFAKKHQAFNNAYYTFGTYALIATIRSVVMIIGNSIIYNGRTRLTLCDIVIDYQDSINGPQILKYMLPSMFATFMDTFISLFVIFIATKICHLIKRISHKEKTKASKNIAAVLIVGTTILGCIAFSFKTNAIEGDNFIKKFYSSEEGLLGGGANGIVQTQDGAIWVGTYGGVYKFNGKTFEMMRDMPQARSVESLYVDDEDNLWISSNGTGLVVRNDKGDIFSISEENGLSSNTVRAVTKVRNQIYYVGTVDEISIVKFDGTTLEVIGSIPEIIYAKKFAVTDGGYVVATANNGDAYLLKDDKILDTFSKGEIINSAYAISNNELYLSGEQAHIYKVNVSKNNFDVKECTIVTELDSVKSVLVSSDNIIYIAGNDSVGYINEKGVFNTIHTGSFNNSIENVMEDYQGNIWFASVRCGLLELGASSFSNLFDVCNVESVGVNAVINWNGLLYVGTDSGLVVLNEERSARVENYATELFSEKRIRSLGVDASNHLWVSTQTEGAYEIEKEDSIYNYNVEDGLPDTRARCTLFLSDGTAMVSTYSGISYIKDHKITKTLVTNRDMLPAYGLCLLEVDEHTVFVGTNGDGICVLKDGKVEKYITHKEGIPSGVILNIYKDKQGGGYFVLSGSGLCYMDSNYYIKEFTDFPYYNNTDLFQTTDGDVVVLSTAGIYIVSYDELMTYGPVNALHLDESMGLPGCVTSNARNYMTNDDVLYFAGNTGVYKLDCSDYYIKVNSYNLNLAAALIDDEATQMDNNTTIKVPAGAKKLTMEFELYNFTTTNPYVRYYMGDVDTEPTMVLANDLQEIVYYGMKSGIHSFTVEVLDPNNLEVLETRKYIIDKGAEKYETTLFKIYYVCGITLIAITMVVWIAIIVIDLNAQREKRKYSEAIAVMEKEKAEALEKSLEREELANRSKSDFLANMSHEIRTPINAIIGMDTMILRESDQPEIKEYAHNIFGASNTLLSLINDILDFSKIESGKMELVPDDYSLGSLINDIVVMMRPKAEAKQLNLNVEINPNTPVNLYGDEGRIKQILINILNNAVKYTKKGYVTLKLDYRQVNFDHIALDFCVSDTGIGIKEEDLGKLFSAFDRIEENRNKNIEGTGLGMSITSNLLALMDSKLEVESVYGKGSDFSFTLIQPFKGDNVIGNYEDYTVTSMPEADEAESFCAPDANILAVDDVEMNLIVVKSLLKRTRIQIDTADSGLKAIEKASEKQYDLILLDAMMPKMDGVETLSHIRSKCVKNQMTPVVMLTANAIKGAREEYLEKGFNDYLSKPIDERQLDDIVRRYIPKEKQLLPGMEGFDAEGASPAKRDSNAVENDFLSFAEGLPMIDVPKGIKAAGGEDVYEMVTKNFYETAGSRISMLKNLFEGMDVENYTIQVHALKSSARLIGALELSDLALELEMAGKEGNTERIKQDTQRLIDLYENIYGQLSKYFGAVDKAKDDSKKDISPKKFKRRIEEIKELLEAFDNESAKQAFENLTDNYRIPEEYADNMNRIQGAFAEVDRDELLKLFEEM